MIFLETNLSERPAGIAIAEMASVSMLVLLPLVQNNRCETPRDPPMELSHTHMSRITNIPRTAALHADRDCLLAKSTIGQRIKSDVVPKLRAR